MTYRTDPQLEASLDLFMKWVRNYHHAFMLTKIYSANLVSYIEANDKFASRHLRIRNASTGSLHGIVLNRLKVLKKRGMVSHVKIGLWELLGDWYK